MDTIDIEDFAEAVKSFFVNWFVETVWAAIIVEVPALANSIVAGTIRSGLKWVAEFLATKAGFVAFMINTGVFTKDQAKDFVEAIRKIETLPADAPDAEWEAAENEANHAFSNLIRFSA